MIQLSFKEWYDEIGSNNLSDHLDTLSELEQDEWDEGMSTGEDSTAWLEDAYVDYLGCIADLAYENYKDRQLENG